MLAALNSLLPAHPWARAAAVAASAAAALALGRKAYRLAQLLILTIICGGADRALYKRKRQLFQQRLADLAVSLGRPPRVLELGAGTGVNFKYLPEGSSLVALDPLSEARGTYARAASRAAGVHLEAWVTGFAEDLGPLEADSFDAVISSLTMCTVWDLDRMLSEVKRVLRPGGLFLYVDHTLSDRAWVRVAQYAVTPVWYLLSAGCHFRLPQRRVSAAGFTRCEFTEFNGALMRPLLTRMVEGWAVK